MRREETRRVEIKEKEWNNRPNYKYGHFQGYFHKWFDYRDNEKTSQKAIIELLDGNVKVFNLEDYNIRFLSEEEMSQELNLKNSKEWDSYLNL